MFLKDTCLQIIHLSLFLFTIVLFFMPGIHKMLANKANREDPDQTASSDVVYFGSALFV